MGAADCFFGQPLSSGIRNVHAQQLESRTGNESQFGLDPRRYLNRRAPEGPLIFTLHRVVATVRDGEDRDREPGEEERLERAHDAAREGARKIVEIIDDEGHAMVTKALKRSDARRDGARLDTA